MISPNLLEPSQHGRQRTLQVQTQQDSEEVEKAQNGILLKYADKMFMKQKMTKIENRNQMSDEKL